jgi:hypothetical protein
LKDLPVSAVHVSWCQEKAERFAPVITDQVRFETVKPAHGVFADFGHVPENPVTFDASAVTDGNSGAVHEGNAGTFAEADGVREKQHGHKKPMLNFHETAV